MCGEDECLSHGQRHGGGGGGSSGPKLLLTGLCRGIVETMGLTSHTQIMNKKTFIAH